MMSGCKDIGLAGYLLQNGGGKECCKIALHNDIFQQLFIGTRRSFLHQGHKFKTTSSVVLTLQLKNVTTMTYN